MPGSASLCDLGPFSHCFRSKYYVLCFQALVSNPLYQGEEPRFIVEISNGEIPCILTLHMMHVHGYLHTLADLPQDRDPSTLCVEIWVDLSIVLN